MKIFNKLATASIALLVAMPAHAMVIDLFQDIQQVSSTGPGDPQGSEKAVAGIPGGFRDLFVLNTSDRPAAQLDNVTLRSGGGFLTFNSGNFDKGIGRVTYDGQDFNAETTDEDGLAGFDLTFGIDDPAFFFDAISGDPFSQFEFMATATDIDGNSASVTETISFDAAGNPDATVSPFLPFAAFTGVDLSRAGSLSFQISSDTPGSRLGIDGSIGSITVVPLPASSLLLLGSVGGVFGAFAAVGRRRRRAA